jgi:outer membrane murein-binding lipoprotein Lpp
MTMKEKPFLVVLLIMVAGGSLCVAQMSPEEAQQKLQDKIAAATQPDVLQAQIKSLRAEIDDLKRQLAAAKAENEQLKQKLAVFQPVAPANGGPANGEPAKAPQSTFTSRAKTTHWGPSHYPPAEILDAEKTDAEIDALAARTALKPEMVAALHEGKPTIGMPEEGLKIIMILKKQAESESGTTYLGWTKQQIQRVQKPISGPDGKTYYTDEEGVDYSKWPKIIVQNGVVTEIDAAQ